MNLQAGNTNAHLAHILPQPDSNGTPPATSEERVGALIKSHGQALCKLPRKKELAILFLELHPNIKSDVASVDPNEVYNLAIKLSEISAMWKTRNRINGMKNEDLATVLVGLMSVVEVVMCNLSKMREQERSASAVSMNTRRNNTTPPTPT